MNTQVPDSPEQWLEQMQAWKDAPLHPDLAPYVEDLTMGRCLRHPLVYQIPLVMPGQANAAYEAKKRQAAEALEQGNHHTYVFIHERPYRFERMRYVLATQGLDIETEEPWHLLRDVWIDSENVWQHFEEWADLFADENAHRMMLETEREALALLPEVVEVYRGVQMEVNEEGLSYTLDKDRALWFATRWPDDTERAVIVAKVRREHIVALLTTRNENEVLVLPEHVEIDHYEEA
jgi:hypothetical protein